MSVTPVKSATTAPAESGASKAKLDREAFLKLLVAQISNQDPLSPMQGTEFVTQLSQFSMVEQAVQQTERLDLLSAQMGGLANGQASALVGKQVSVRGKSVAFDGTNATSANVTLASPAAKVTATLRNQDGEAVRTIELGGASGGALNVKWDGRDDAGRPVPAGSYGLEVKAVDKTGAPVDVSQDVTGVVLKVSFDKGYPELVLDSGAVAPVSDLVSVGAAQGTEKK
jgi:flagellar basal-body rod modification protein FlgD